MSGGAHKTSRVDRRPTLLWHLLEEGCATTEQLVELTGWSIGSISNAVSKLVKHALATSSRDAEQHRCVYALTPAGIEAAQQVEREQVVFAAARRSNPDGDRASVLPFKLHVTPEPKPARIDATGPVFAVNSRGELAIDSGCGHLLRMAQPHALALKRFLDNISVIEEATP